jgi:hypothetical protein
MATQVIATQAPVYGRYDADKVRERNQLLLAAQQRVRRGPTPEVFFTKRIDNSRLVTANDPQPGAGDAEFRQRDGAVVRADHGLRMAALQRDRIRLSHRVGESSRLSCSANRTANLRLTEAQLGRPGADRHDGRRWDWTRRCRGRWFVLRMRRCGSASAGAGRAAASGLPVIAERASRRRENSP